MAKQKAIIVNPEKVTNQPVPEKVTVELTTGHPLFNKKLKKQPRYEVSGKLAEKGVKNGHFKIV